MAVKKLPGQEIKPETKKESKGYEDKPKVQDYYKQNQTKDGEAFAVEKIKLTESGWLIVETESWVGFINGKTSLAQYIINTLAPALHNKQGQQMVALASKKHKNKFVLGLEDEVRMWYYFDSEAKLLETSIEKEDFLAVTEGTLSIEDFMLTE